MLVLYQVQWGVSDDIILYNDVIEEEVRGKRQRSPRVAGIRHNVSSSHRTILPCSLYHVSEDGRLAVSPKLIDMPVTQLGYGAYLPGYHPRVSPLDSAERDGVYVMDIEAGRCHTLVSLSNIARYLKLAEGTPLYGFHTKLTSDKKYVMVCIFD